MTPETAMLDAALAVLHSDAGVQAIVGNKVLDEVPADRSPVKPPYVYIGPINRQRVPDTAATAWTMRMRLYAVSTGYGRREAWELADALSRGLGGIELVLAEDFDVLGPVIVTQAGDVVSPPSPKTAFVDIEVQLQENDDA